MSIFTFNYISALYRRNNKGEPCVWIAENFENHSIIVHHGVIGKTIIKSTLSTKRSVDDEIKTMINNKRKKGYKYLSELKDNNSIPVEGELYNYLLTYLPANRTTADGSLLPMLAKTYDNENNKLFKNIEFYFGQYKINGLRCIVRPYRRTYDMFSPIGLKFQSRESTYWESLGNLEDYLIDFIGEKFLNEMLENDWGLDGELYLPGHTVNQINHFVKDANCIENKAIQFWCYDLCAEDLDQTSRFIILKNNFHTTELNRNEHFTNKNRFIYIAHYVIFNDIQSMQFRNAMVGAGFEGLILRNPNSEYQFGKRNSTMIKYKKSTDGKFQIIDIYPEGNKRNDIPIFKLRNDINNETFEVHCGGSLDYQRNVLRNKENYISKLMYVEYGERSGVNQVPFHVKQTYIINDLQV